MFELLGLIALGLPIALVVLIVVAVRQSGAISRLQSQVQGLEGRISRVESAPRPRDETVLNELRTGAAVVTPAPVVETPAAPETPTPEAMDVPPAPPEPPVAEPAAPPPPSARPKQRFDWERFVGLRLPVWLGAIALSVAGFFFVGYAIESGFFTPEMRVLSAAASSVLFLAGAEFVRRRVKTGNVAAIASALAAASIATAYATAYLATKTYGLVPSGAGFIVTIGVSILAIAIALAFGEAVALIGIVGGYVAPAVYGGGDANAPFLVAYLLMLTAVTFAIIRYRSWWRLSAIGLVGPAFWGLIWAATPALRETLWSDVYFIGYVVIVTAATWDAWRRNDAVLRVAQLRKWMTAEHATLIAAAMFAAVGFVLLIGQGRSAWVLADGTELTVLSFTHWIGFVLYAALAVGLGLASQPHRFVQIAILPLFALGFLVGPTASLSLPTVALAAGAIIFAVGALDNFRRMREPGLWAAVASFVGVAFYLIAVFKVTGWGDAIANRHWWALGALAIAAAFIVLLRLFAERVEGELERSQVYAAWGGAVTTLVSLAIVLELDPLYFPAAAALAILGLAAVHMRAPVRGLRVVAGLYLAIYVLLLLGAFSYTDGFGYMPSYWSYVLVRNASDHALALMVIPGIALLTAGTLFQLGRPTEARQLVAVIDMVALIAAGLGLFYLLAWPYANSRWTETLVLASRIVGPELALAAVAVYVGRRFDRQAAYTGGIILTGLMVLAMLAGLILPLLQFWPPFAVPGTLIVNITLVAYGVPALLLYFIGWYLRHERRQGIRLYGIAVSIFAVVVTYAMLMLDIRHAYHLSAPTLEGDMSQSEYYAYSIGTLAFGLALLIGGVAFKHRGARAVSFFFVLAATIKVFLFDASELTGLWRVLSFLLMGLSFLGISWAYARFVFGIGTRKEEPPAPPAPPVVESPEGPAAPQS